MILKSMNYAFSNSYWQSVNWSLSNIAKTLSTISKHTNGRFFHRKLTPINVNGRLTPIN